MAEFKLNPKVKELIAVGTSVSAGCLRCCNHHFKKVFEEGATLEEVKKAVVDATSAINSAKETMQQKAYSLMNIQRKEVEEPSYNGSDRITVLVQIGAAVASNCTTTIEKYIEIAKTMGITSDEITVTVNLAKFILKKAGEFADEAISEVLIKAAIETV